MQALIWGTILSWIEKHLRNVSPSFKAVKNSKNQALILLSNVLRNVPLPISNYQNINKHSFKERSSLLLNLNEKVVKLNQNTKRFEKYYSTLFQMLFKCRIKETFSLKLFE